MTWWTLRRRRRARGCRGAASIRRPPLPTICRSKPDATSAAGTLQVVEQRDLLKRYLDAGIAFTAMTRARAEGIVKELVRAGEIQREQVQTQVDDLVQRSRHNTDQLRSLVRKEIESQFSLLGLATKRDLAALERRLTERFALATKRAPAKKAATSAKKSSVKKGSAKKAAATESPATGSPATGGAATGSSATGASNLGSPAMGADPQQASDS